jgi:hypothetical protein
MSGSSPLVRLLARATTAPVGVPSRSPENEAHEGSTPRPSASETSREGSRIASASLAREADPALRPATMNPAPGSPPDTGEMSLPSPPREPDQAPAPAGLGAASPPRHPGTLPMAARARVPDRPSPVDADADAGVDAGADAGAGATGRGSPTAARPLPESDGLGTQPAPTSPARLPEQVGPPIVPRPTTDVAVTPSSAPAPQAPARPGPVPVRIGRIEVQVAPPAAERDPFAGLREVAQGLTARRGGGW